MRLYWYSLACLWISSIRARSSRTVQRKAHPISKGANGWSKENFPYPLDHPSECRTTSGNFCDPDGLISRRNDLKRLEDSLSLSRPSTIPCMDGNHMTLDRNTSVSFYVAFVRQMDKRGNATADDQIGMGAEAFALHLYTSWHLGNHTMENKCQGAGVLVLLVEDDHLIYVARGPALTLILTDARVERLIGLVQSKLQQGSYVKAIIDLVEGINFYILYGESQVESRNCPVHLWFLCGMGFCFVAQLALSRAIEYGYRQLVVRDNRKAKQWSETDRIHAEALRRRFQAQSCPICLNPFERNHVGSDVQPLRLLRCGHVLDSTCWSTWEATCIRDGDVPRCPICRQVEEGATIASSPTTCMNGTSGLQTTDQVSLSER